MSNTELFIKNSILQRILKESFGGVLYDVANRNKYNTKKLSEEWNKLSDIEKRAILSDGRIEGALHFVGIIKKKGEI